MDYFSLCIFVPLLQKYKIEKDSASIRHPQFPRWKDTKVCSFSRWGLACRRHWQFNRYWWNQKDKTTWVDCAYWTDRTGIAPYLKKGTQVYVEGTPDVRSYTTADGRQGASLTLRIVSVQLLGAKPSGGAGGEQPSYGGESSPAPSYNPQPTAGGEAMDDLPF